MSGDQLFEDYDPEMEDIFGSSHKMTPKRITITDAQKTDPLRKPKVCLQALLVAEKQPITAKQIEQRMLEDDGYVMDCKQFGFMTLDDLLCACSDTVIHHRRKDGEHVYMAKVNEANQDIMELVQLQTDRQEAKRAPRSFLSTKREGGGRGGGHGSSFRPYHGPRASSADKPRANTQQSVFQARSTLGPSKSSARVRNLADVLRSYRAEIGRPHPKEPNRKIVSLLQLQEQFKKVYGLPAWGKYMSEKELYDALNAPEFEGILKFWRLTSDGDVYVEEVETLTQNQEEPKKQKEQEEKSPEVSIHMPCFNISSSTPRRARSVHSVLVTSRQSLDDESIDAFSSVGDRTPDATMVLEEDQGDGFFESGPGFGGRKGFSDKNRSGPQTAEQLAELTSMFGNSQSSAPTASVAPKTTTTTTTTKMVSSEEMRTYSPLSYNDSTFGFNTEDSLDEPEPPRAPVAAAPAPAAPLAARPEGTVPSRALDAAAFPTRSIISRNPTRVLANFIKDRGSVAFSALPTDDRTIVNFNSRVFHVYATQPGEMYVRLADPTCDVNAVTFSDKELRDPLEPDLRWMSESALAFKNGRHLVKPVMFVAPRGFLVLVADDWPSSSEEGDYVETKIERLENVLRSHMQQAPVRDLERKQMRPGMAAAYIYREHTEVRYYRVLVLGKAHREGDVMVLLVDHNDQYCVDVQMNQLFALPDKVGFKHFAPNVVFATLYGVSGMAEEEQQLMYKNADDEDRKQFITGWLCGEKGKILNIDMTFRDEQGNVAWLSSIAKRRGAMMCLDAPRSSHNQQPAKNFLDSPEDAIDFLDYTTTKKETEVKGGKEGRNGEKQEQQKQQPLREIETEEYEFDSDLESTSPLSAPTPPATAIVSSVSAAPLPASLSPFDPQTLDVYALFDRGVREKDWGLLHVLSTFARTVVLSAHDEKGEWKQLHKYMVDVGSQNGMRLL
ncbi:unnamed protein product [Caenorhabditis sp. 36 PRJEB53466]|nr:unnamed protein product [Caenorhabditis sp. 36 PRJEB53466]